MTRAHDLPEAIQWSEGMLLTPQHFQQSALRQEGLIAYHAAVVDPHHWGVLHLKIDPVTLKGGRFQVVELEAIMPDGLAVSSVQVGTDGLALDLSEHKEAASREPLRIHLTVPARRSHGGGVVGELPRYRSVDDAVAVADENTGEGEEVIGRLRPRIGLAAGDKPLEKHQSFPLAEVVYDSDSFALGDFVPPSLRVEPGSDLHKASADLATRVREKALELAGKVRSPSLAEGRSLLLDAHARTLVAALPPFEALIASGVAHPFSLWLGLCGLVGQVAGLGRGRVPPTFDAYDHDDPLRCFGPALRFVEKVLSEVFIEEFEGHTFRYRDGRFLLEVERSWLERTLILAVAGHDGRGDRAEEWMDQAMIGSLSRIDSIRQRRIRGVERRRTQGEGSLVPLPGVVLYELEPDPEVVSPGEPLVIQNPDDPAGRERPKRIDLYVRNEPGGATG